MGMTWTYGSKAKVYKSKPWLNTSFGYPWKVSNHPCGNMQFATWREAYDYANSRPVLMNAH